MNIGISVVICFLLGSVVGSLFAIFKLLLDIKNLLKVGNENV